MKLNQYIDHTILKANATEADVVQLCEEARQHELFSVCINRFGCRPRVSCSPDRRSGSAR